MEENIIVKLQKIASNNINQYDPRFNPMEYSGGNFDDSYRIGVEDGQTILAREILDKLGVKY